MVQKKPGTRAERLLDLIRMELTIGSLLVLVVSLISLLGFLSPSIDIYSHFRWQYALLLLLSLIAAILLKQRYLTYALLGGSLVNAGCLGILWVAEQPRNTNAIPALSILNMNLQYGNRDTERIVHEIMRTKPDIVSVEELTPEMLTALVGRLPEYRHQCVAPRSDAYGIGLFSRLPFTHSDTNPLKLPLSLVIQGDVRVSGKAVSIMAIHACGPTSTIGTNLDREIAESIKRFRKEHPAESFVLIGDMNSTPWSCIFQRILKAGDFTDSERGFGLQCSWPSTMPLLSIPIDHCFFSKDWSCLTRSIEPSIGSDHYPLLVRLAPESAQEPAH